MGLQLSKLTAGREQEEIREKIALGEKEFHMGRWPFECVEQLSRKVHGEEFGAMGATEAVVFIDSDENTVRSESSNGGNSFFIQKSAA